MPSSRIALLDWMKSVGMLLIVYGHSQGSTNYLRTPPFNPKQLGVTLFLFATGYSLALAQRPRWREVYQRLFEPFLVGLTVALVFSLCSWWSTGNLAESNYMPFVAGSNLVLDDFPANSTTWYIGTYIHVLLIWACFLRGRTICHWMVAVGLVIEIASRMILQAAGWHYVAYMLFTNWITIFLLGTYAGQHHGREPVRMAWSCVGAGILGLLATVWPLCAAHLTILPGFPFQQISLSSPPADLLITSLTITGLYSGYTWSFYLLARALPRSTWVEFFSRNTLFIFFVHMPLINWISPWLYGIIELGAARVLCNLFLYYLGLAAISEGLRQIVPIAHLRNQIGQIWFAPSDASPVAVAGKSMPRG